MANSYVEYTTAGSGTNGLGQTTFTAPTQFLSINDIRVKGYNGSSWTELTITEPRGTTTVTLSAAPSAYSKIRVFRSSTTEALIDFQNGSRLAESDLDTAYRQSLFVAQEVAEDADPEGGSGIGNIVNSQLAGGITNDKLAGSITQDKLAGGITSAQLAGSIADSKLASGVGTSANNLVKLDGTAKLPAVDGSQLTGIVTGSTKMFSVALGQDQQISDITETTVAFNTDSDASHGGTVFDVGNCWDTTNYRINVDSSLQGYWFIQGHLYADGGGTVQSNVTVRMSIRDGSDAQISDKQAQFEPAQNTYQQHGYPFAGLFKLVNGNRFYVKFFSDNANNLHTTLNQNTILHNRCWLNGFKIAEI